jgi:hypothetical protein
MFKNKIKKNYKMRKTALSIMLILMLLLVFACDRSEESFTFVVAADMRYAAKEEYRNSNYFQGACEAIKKYGKGAFMISPGDIDPPLAVREVISNILGEDYPWYPVVGNHELEDSSNMDFLRNYNKDGNTLPNIVRSGPEGSLETTYSFDWGDNHFVVLNQYYDGLSDMGTDGDLVPELLDWLEEDLTNTDKKYIFVFGHEPLIAMPDMDNGRLRHQDDSLNKYPKNSYHFHQMLLRFHVTGYICGHTHNTSIAKINDVWQIDVGHARGIEAFFPGLLVEGISSAIAQGEENVQGEKTAFSQFYNENAYEAKKVLYYSGLTDGISYKEIDDKTAIKKLYSFYTQYLEHDQLRNQYQTTFWENANLARSTFLKIQTGAEKVKIDIYRDDARGGAYALMHTKVLN